MPLFYPKCMCIYQLSCQYQHISIILIIMLNDSQYSQELQNLTLNEILEQDDLVMEEILSIRDIHNNIKRNLKVFTEYCRRNPSFTQKFIALGLKCPMHQSNNSNMKNITYIAADVLSCDHQSLSDLFILPSKKSMKEDDLIVTGDEIQEEIQTDIGQANNEQEINKYKFLQNVFEYINSEELDQNCLNYITKALNILIRRKLSQLLQFFHQNPAILKRLVDLSHYPSISHFLAKLLTEEQEHLSHAALEVKKIMVPLILQKIHANIFKPQTIQVLQCIEDILNSSKYGDLQQRSQLQKVSDSIVSAKEYTFHLQNIISALSNSEVKYQNFIGVTNSASFLTVVINRMNMDQQQDYNFTESQQFKPTLIYEVEGLYSNFCKLIALYSKIWELKPKFQAQFWFMANKIIEPLILMSKHSRFGQFYKKISKEQRLQALKTLIFVACQIKIHGILLQSVTSLLQKMLIQEEKLAEGQNQIVFPGDLYNLISQHASSIGILVSSLLEQTTNQRNRNENGIYFRKILVLLDNYFKHTAVLHRYPNTGSLSTIFPLFNKQVCKIFAQKAAILNHPDGKKVRQVSQFQFLQKNNNIRRSNSLQLEQQPKPIEVIPETKIQPQKKAAQIVFKLEGKLKALKERVKQKQADKDQTTQAKSNSLHNVNPKPVQEVKIQMTNQKSSPNRQKDSQPKQEQKSPSQICKQKQPQSGLNFFVRHLMIY